jgi:glucokinase
LRNFSKIKSVGVGCPGDTDFDNGIMRFIPQFPNFKNVPLAKLLESEIGKKVYIDNDANVAALGAFYIDAGGKATNLVYVTLGTGIGGGLIFNKEVYRGSSGSAGEIGHIAVEPKRGPNCDCGSVGCVEAFTGERYFLKYVEGYLQHHPSKIISELREKNNNQLSGKLLFDAAEMGDKIAKEMWEHYGEKLGFMLADIINILNPDTIVLGGGMSKSSKYFMPTIQKEVKNRAYASAVKTCNIIVSQQGGNLGTAGAAMLAKEGIANNDKLDRTDSL